MRAELSAIGIRGPWSALLVARNFVRTVWDPTRSDVQHGIRSLVYGALRDLPPERVAALEREPALAALYAEGYDPQLDPARLEALPDGSLGREYARFLAANRIDPLGTLLAMDAPRNLAQYLFRRAYKLHDLMHVALGCDATVLGEVQIVAYSLGQSRERAAGRAPGLALAVLFLHLALRRPEALREAVRLAHTWLERGERARPHVAIRLEDHLAEPVERVREMVLAPA